MIPKQYKNHVPDNVTSYINGEFVSPKGAVALPIIYPGNGEQVSELFEADFQQVDDAVNAAKQSLDKGVWSNTSTVEKQKVFQNICALTAENLDELAALETINTGQTLSYSTHAQFTSRDGELQVLFRVDCSGNRNFSHAGQLCAALCNKRTAGSGGPDIVL